MDNSTVVAELSDDELLLRLDRWAANERESLPEMLACVSEVERRELHLDRGFSSMLEYCVERLGWSEGSAMQRLIVAKTASRYPEALSYLRDGQLNLSAVSRLSAHLTPENRTEVLSRAAGRKRADLDELLRQLRASAPRVVIESPADAIEPPPQGDLTFGAAVSPAAAVSAPAAEPPSENDLIGPAIARPERVSLLVDEGMRRDLERSRELLKRPCPSGALSEVIAYLLREFLRRRDPALRAAAVERPRRAKRTRDVPQWVKDRVWKRDGGRCAYVSRSGRRCSRRGALEYDHVIPWARGGSSDDPENIRLLCRAHNLHLARRQFGDRVPRRAS